METVSIPKQNAPSAQPVVQKPVVKDPDDYDDDFEAYEEDFEEDDAPPKVSPPAKPVAAVSQSKPSRASPSIVDPSPKGTGDDFDQVRKSMQMENEAALETKKRAPVNDSKDDAKAHLK
jgi:hypothetical protein